MLEALKKKVVGMIPGTPVNLAQKKREFEKRLRAQGYSRTQAMTMTSQHFAKPLQGL